MTWLTGFLKAIAEALLGFLGDRIDQNKADNAQKEAGARETEAKHAKRMQDAAREAMDLRARPPGSDADLDDGLRAPGDRGKGRGN